MIRKGNNDMPHVAITMIPGRNPQQKKELAKKVQDLLITEQQLDGKFISVSVEDIPMENWQQFMDKFPEEVMYVKPGV